MHRVAPAALFATVALTLTACGSDDTEVSTVPTAAPAGPVATSQQLDRPFPVAGDGWDATVTLSGLRIVPSSVYIDSVLAVDLRMVQASGQPVIDPGDLRAFDPAGRQFERIEYPAGTIPDPLIRSQMTSPGQEIRGTVAWKVPRGTRIGRIDLVTTGTIGSVTVTRQPVDPSAAPAR